MTINVPIEWVTSVDLDCVAFRVACSMLLLADPDAVVRRSAADISKAGGMNRPVQRQLHRLRQLGLIAPHADGWKLLGVVVEPATDDGKRPEFSDRQGHPLYNTSNRNRPVEQTIAAAPPSPQAYRWSGTVIRLNARDYERWVKAYPHLSLDTELEIRDQWLAANGGDQAARTWFFPTMAHFRNLNAKAAATKEAADKTGKDRIARAKRNRLVDEARALLMRAGVELDTIEGQEMLNAKVFELSQGAMG